MDDWLSIDVVDDTATLRSDKVNKVVNTFSGIEDAMNIPAGSTPLPKGLVKNVKQNVELAVQSVKEALADPEESFEDKEFIREVIKTQIIKMQSTLEIMEGNFMVGSEPRMFEVYSDLNKSVLDACARLMLLQKQSDNAKMMKAPVQNELIVTETKQIKAKGSDMSSFLEQLRGPKSD